MTRRSLEAFASIALLASAPFSAPGQTSKITVRPAVRVTEKVNTAVVQQLAGTHPVVVENALVGSRIAASTPFKHMILVLQPSADQEYALRSLLDSQQDKTSPSYHQWLTPETFGASFGVASSDVASVKSWMQDSGLTVESISKSSRFIVFSGTAGAVESAFHTEMHNVTVNGETHVSNTTDISVPAALAPVVRGVASLNNFFPKSDVHDPRTVTLPATIPAGNYVTPDAKPLYTSVSSGAHYVSPGDAAIIYNSTPLLTGGIDGSGQNIAVIGRTDINLSDVQQFRSMFGLPKQDPTFTVVGDDPGTTSDDIEAYLDVEWAGGMAPKANVNFITAGSDYFTNSGIAASGLYAVENNVADIITLSYGGCETNNGASGTAFWNTLWEQAAAQGQSAFVSSGDSNATGCQSSSATYGTAYGVNALGSSAYNVAVGGSMFVDYNPSAYWGAGQSAPAPAGYTFTTATSYIPEAALNQGTLTTTYLNTASTAAVTGSGIFGTGGGISIYTARPSWQTGSGISPTADSKPSSGTGIGTPSPAGTGVTGLHRLVPDISFIAASGHDATVFCAEGSCTNTSAGYGIGAVGGTSVATPVMASVQALINQRNGGRQGNPNFYYYPLANNDYATGSSCQATNGTAASPSVTLPASTCNFHDIVAGNNRSQQNASDTVGLGFDAVAGFDSASGLGSVNIANVANNWAAVAFRATTTSFSLSPTTGINHGASQIFSATVTAASGSGTPTGDIYVVAELANAGSYAAYTLTNGAVSSTLNSLPGGTYNVHVHYAGDGTFGSSDSPSVPVTIGKENSSVAMKLTDFYPGFYQTNPTSIPYGYLVNIIATASGTSGNGSATGTTTFAISQNGSSLPSLPLTVDAQGNAAFLAGAGLPSLLVSPNYPTLNPGVYTVTANYSGDSSFNPSSGASTFTVAKVTPGGTFTASASSITSGSSVQLTYTLSRISSSTFTSLAAYPTGTVAFTDTTSGAVLGTATLNGLGVATLSTTAITTSGANTITAVYSGDTNYATLTGSGTVTVGSLTSTTTTLSVTGTYSVGNSVPLTVSVTPAASGTVTFYDGTTLLGSTSVTASGGTATVTVTTSALTAGSHTLSATFGGNTTYAASTGTTTVSLNQNTTSLALDSPVVSVYGQTVALAGRISRSPSVATPLVGLTGTITFKDGGTTLGTATPVYLPGGYLYYTGTFSTAAMLAGSHTITASYSGDTNYTASNSGSVSLNIAQYSPAITITAPASAYGSSATFTLTSVLPISGAMAAPTGSITFYNGGATLGSVVPTYSAASGGYVATYTVSGLTAGPHTLTAAYAGDANYAAVSSTMTILITTNNIWVANGNNSISAITNSGTALTPVAVSGGGTAIAVDGNGNVWSLNKSANSIAEFNNSGAVISSGYKVGGIAAPTSLVIDGAGIVWIANADGTISGVSSNGTPGVAVNPTSYNVGGSIPTSIVVDGSGNLWMTNSGDNSVTEVFGVATPVMTPTTTAVKTNTLAVKP